MRRLLHHISACVLLVLAASVGRPTIQAGALYPGSDPMVDRLVQQEQFEEAMDSAVATLRRRAERSGVMAPATLAGLELVGRTACDAGEYAIGESIIDATLDAYRRLLGPDDPLLATSWITLGRIARLKGQRPRAWQRYQEARRLLRAAGPTWESVRAELEEAEGDWFRKDDMTEALALYQRSLERRHGESPAPSFQEADRLTWIGWMLGRMGRFAEAEPYLRKARRQLSVLGLAGHSLNGVIANAFAERLALEGRWDEAERDFREVTRIFAAARRKYPPGFARRILPLDGPEALTLLALRRGRGEEAWKTLQQSRAAVHLDFALLGLWDLRDPEGFQKAQVLRRKLLEVRRTLARRSPGGRLSWTPDTWRLILDFLEDCGRLRSLQARYLTASPTPAVSLARVQKMLGPRSALLGFLEVDLGGDSAHGAQAFRKEGWLYVLRRSSPIVWIRLTSPDDRDVVRFGHAWVRTLRAAFWPSHVDADPEVAADQRVLARRYLDPALPYLLGIEHLVVEGALLPVEAMRGPDGRLAGDTFDVTYVPSALVASLLAARGTEESEKPLRSILAISAAAPRHGAATLEPPALLAGGHRDLRRSRKSYMRDETSLDRLPTLPYAAAEVSLIAKKFPQAMVFQGRADVERRLREIAGGGLPLRFDIVHFAGHTLGDGSPELAGLALAERDDMVGPEDDGILDVEEIRLGWDLDTRLLTLSGCETARAAGAERGEFLGFTPALFEAGARNILSSLWPVDDRATALLMDRFYDNLTGRYSDTRMGERGIPMSLARALREAKRHIRELADERGRRPFEHPAYWAGFILMGVPEAR